MDPAEQAGGRQDPGAIDALRVGLDEAIAHLADLNAEDDLEDLARMLNALVATASESLQAAAAAPDPRLADLEAGYGRLLEARDLLDDGEPPDTVAFEVMAARDLLRRR